jgi:hypothetical protein
MVPDRDPLEIVEAGLADDWELTRALVARHASMVDVEQPLVLISQVQRSGGTLLSSLFDGHPEVLVHPWELQIGKPTKYDWPRLDPGDDPAVWLVTLEQPWLRPVFTSGYVKGRGRLATEPGHPLLLPPSFLERLMFSVTAARPPQTSREVLDRYFTAFFNAWLDLQGLWDEPKRWVVGFAPRLAWAPNAERMRADYPDGRVICVLRDPRGWYASAAPHFGRQRGFDAEEGLALWCRGANEMISLKEAYGADVFVLSYERLVTQPETVTRALCDWLGIAWSRSMLQPTFNRRPVVANSSFDDASPGIEAVGAERWRHVLDGDTCRWIEERALDLHQAALSHADA